MNSQNATSANIFYRLDTGRTDGKLIRLGMLLLLPGGNVLPKGMAAALILLARTRLKPDEVELIDPVARVLLSNPAEFFRAEIDSAPKHDGDDVFRYMSQKFSWSIYVAPPAPIQIPGAICEIFRDALAGAHQTTPNPPRVRSKPINRRKGLVARATPNLDVLADLAGPDLRDELAFPSLPPAWTIEHANANCRHPHWAATVS
jgi:hypothetical protein